MRRSPALLHLVAVCLLCAAAIRPAGAQPAFPEAFKRWSELSVAGSVSTVDHLRVASGRLTLVLTSGRAAPVLAGATPVGIFFQGVGALEYASTDPVELPIVSYNVRKNTDLEATPTGPTLVIRDSFDELLLLVGGEALPSLPSAVAGGAALDGAFAKHVKRFGQVQYTPAAHQFTAWLSNGANGPQVRAEVSGGKEDFLYLRDEDLGRSETLCTLRKSKILTDRQYLTVLSDQPVGRDRREPTLPRFILSHVDLAVTAPGGDDLSLTATETFAGVAGRTGALLLDLYDTKFGRDALDPHHLRVKGVFDAAGNPVPFDHRTDELLVGLAKPLAPGESVTLRFEIEGDILHRPRGDSYWELGVEPWFPQPDLAGQFYTAHTNVRVKKPFVPFAPGATIRRGEEGQFNVLETRVERPVQFMVVLAGDYVFQEETRNGVTVRVASYAGASANTKRLLKLTHEMLAFYQPFLGPFPFSEFDIVEINEWGYGQAPPGFMFITQEAFNPLGGEVNKLFSRGINERLAHEIAHQYWGHVVKMPSHEEQWLTESFAEVSAGLLIRALRGKSDFDGLTNYWRSRAKEATAIAPIPLANRIRNHSDSETAWYGRTFLLYAKGPSLLNSIRLELGDDEFLKFLRSCQATFAWRFGNTKTVRMILDTITKKDWAPFFDDYYWGTAMPSK